MEGAWAPGPQQPDQSLRGGQRSRSPEKVKNFSQLTTRQKVTICHRLYAFELVILVQPLMHRRQKDLELKYANIAEHPIEIVFIKKSSKNYRKYISVSLLHSGKLTFRNVHTI